MVESLNGDLEDRLREWASWYLRGQDFGLGYPKETLEYKLWRDGILLKVIGRRYEDENINAEEMERWVCDLMRLKPKEAQAIRWRYLTHQSVSLAKIAQNHRVSVKTLEQWLSGARNFLQGCLYISRTRIKNAA